MAHIGHPIAVGAGFQHLADMAADKPEIFLRFEVAEPEVGNQAFLRIMADDREGLPALQPEGTDFLHLYI